MAIRFLTKRHSTWVYTVLDAVNAKTTFAVSAAASHIILERLAKNTKDIKKWLSVSTAMKK